MDSCQMTALSADFKAKKGSFTMEISPPEVKKSTFLDFFLVSFGLLTGGVPGFKLKVSFPQRPFPCNSLQVVRTCKRNLFFSVVKTQSVFIVFLSNTSSVSLLSGMKRNVSRRNSRPYT